MNVCVENAAPVNSDISKPDPATAYDVVGASAAPQAAQAQKTPHKRSWFSPDWLMHLRKTRGTRKTAYIVHLGVPKPFAEPVRSILQTYFPVVDTAATDGFYLDFGDTVHLGLEYEATLRRLQGDVLGRTGLRVSVGAARTQVIASIASRAAGPGRLQIVPPDAERAFLEPLPVGELRGIGSAQARALVRRGVTTIGQLRLIPKPVLMAAFGDAVGRAMWEFARGLDARGRLPNPA